MDRPVGEPHEAGEPAPDDLAQRDPFDVRHRHEMIAVDRAELVDGQQRRARQADAALGLAAELGHAGGVVRQGRLQDLDRHELRRTDRAAGPSTRRPARPGPVAPAAGRGRADTRPPAADLGPDPLRRPPRRTQESDSGAHAAGDPDPVESCSMHPGARSARAEPMALSRPQSQSRRSAKSDRGFRFVATIMGAGSRIPGDGCVRAAARPIGGRPGVPRTAVVGRRPRQRSTVLSARLECESRRRVRTRG